jgi:serine/threonine-protein kinase
LSEEQDDADLQLVTPLVLRQIIAKEAIEKCFRDHTAYRKAGKPYSLLAVMIKNGVLTKTQAFVLKGVSLVDLQPFPDYKFLRHVGEGGMADVYEATYLTVKARVALKVLKTDFCLQEAYRLRFKREANILLALDHENIVEGKEYRSHDGVDFYAMAFVDGVSVLDILDAGVALNEGMALHVASQVASALEHMRQKGIVHRDVKPGNLVVDSDGVVKIIDFGFAKVMSGMRQDTGEETTVGTVEYMSPEQARGETNIDSRADVYSLGATLFHMATGDLPFAGETPAEVMYGHVKKPLEFTKEQQARLSVATIFILRKAMEKDPADRYQTPQAMLDDINALCAPQIAARGPVPAVVHEASVEAAPISIPAPRTSAPHRTRPRVRPHSRIHRRPHR